MMNCAFVVKGVPFVEAEEEEIGNGAERKASDGADAGGGGSEEEGGRRTALRSTIRAAFLACWARSAVCNFRVSAIWRRRRWMDSGVCWGCEGFGYWMFWGVVNMLAVDDTVE